MKKYIYHVNGKDFEGSEVWGDAWKAAQAYAEETHSIITRTVITESEEFFARGCFIGMDNYKEGKAKVF